MKDNGTYIDNAPTWVLALSAVAASVTLAGPVIIGMWVIHLLLAYV